MENKDKGPTFLESLISWGGHVFSKLSKYVDKIVFNRTGSLVLTLVLALGICLSLDYKNLAMTIFDDSKTTSTVSNVQVNVAYDSKLYEISGLPDNVSVSLTGKASDIQLFRQQHGVSVSSDITKYGEGVVYLDFKVDNLPSSISATITPSSVDVMVEKKIEQIFTVTPKLMVGLNQKEDEFTVPILDKNTVKIVGTKTQINTIRKVEAIVDAAGYTKDFTKDATIVAYDSTGNQVAVLIEPRTVKASVKIAVQEQETSDEESKEK
ncbi:MAG: CdaR family protein [Bacillota bacterium]|nr:CdaR family protein [Bacillota bacterium]